MLRIYEIKLGLDEGLERIPEKIEKKLRLKRGSVLDWVIAQESVDARNKKEIKRVYSVLFQVKDEDRVLKGKKGVRVEPVTQEELSFWLGSSESSGAGRESGAFAATEIGAGMGSGSGTDLGQSAERCRSGFGEEEGAGEFVGSGIGAGAGKGLGCGERGMGSSSGVGLGPGGGVAGRPVVVGFGPCGIFAALELARQGCRPVVIERGRPMEDRVADVEAFWETGVLSPVSNVQFGEGGAGAFSDGKLNTGLKKDARIRKVLSELAAAGAPKEILYKQKPHIGTDLLRQVVVNLRKTIQELGGEIYFETQLTGLILEDDLPASPKDLASPNPLNHKRLKGILVNGDTRLETDTLILALGHSARDTFSMLYEKGLPMEQKPFSIGARIEHSQKMIDESQYGNHQVAEVLGAADYKLSYHCKDGRGVYTFCMCPGGYVVASASEEGGVVTNGMSYHKRDGENANSALLVGIEPKDFTTSHPLAGVEFQRKWEQAAFRAGGGDYRAPAQRVGDFLKGIPTEERSENSEKTHLEPTYRPGVRWTDLSECLPEFAIEAMREALPVFGKKIKGFDGEEGILTAVESRSSSPVRIIRNSETLQSEVKGIFPAGEGAGYAGGIMSAAADGLKAAEAVIKNYYCI